MKKSIILFIALSLSLIHCGDIKIDGLEDAIDSIQNGDDDSDSATDDNPQTVETCAIAPDNCADIPILLSIWDPAGDGQTGGVEMSKDWATNIWNQNSGGTRYNEQGEPQYYLGEVLSDTTGGLATIEMDETIETPYEIGSYEPAYMDEDWKEIVSRCTYSFPDEIVIYSDARNGWLRITDGENNLKIIAEGKGEVGTTESHGKTEEIFSFSVTFLDGGGTPGTEVTCNCKADEGIPSGEPDRIQCSCLGSDAVELNYCSNHDQRLYNSETDECHPECLITFEKND